MGSLLLATALVIETEGSGRTEEEQQTPSWSSPAQQLLQKLIAIYYN